MMDLKVILRQSAWVYVVIDNGFPHVSDRETLPPESPCELYVLRSAGGSWPEPLVKRANRIERTA
jgi:hypothetical protein